MPVQVTRRRGATWYAGGTVRVGQETILVAEFSTGCRARTDAEAVAAQRDRDIRDDVLAGPAGRAPRLIIADCLLSYLSRPGGVKAWDAARIAEFNETIGHRPLAQAVDAWRIWVQARAGAQLPTSVARWRAALQAALNHGAAAHGVLAPRLPGVRGAAGEDRVVLLSDDERRQLLAAYNPHAACPALLLAYQGLRTQEALRLDWRQVDLTRRTLHLPPAQTKSRRARTVPLHPRVDALLFGLWHAAGRPTGGPVFLSARGAPYADTRGHGARAQGGNPLARAHATACRIAGITGFRVHDWRHEWAGRMVMAGTDLRTLMELGGWASLRMVQKYASVSADHLVAAVARLA